MDRVELYVLKPNLCSPPSAPFLMFKALDGLLPSPEVHQPGFVQTNLEGERRDRRFMAMGKGEEKRGVRGARDED